MQQNAVFLGRQNDYLQQPQVWIRVPEVLNEVRKAQKEMTDLDVDFVNEAQEDTMSEKARPYMASLIQEGLLQRFKRRFGMPRYLIARKGSVNFLRYLAQDPQLMESQDAIMNWQETAGYEVFNTQTMETKSLETENLEELFEQLYGQMDVKKMIYLDTELEAFKSQNLDPYYDRIQVSSLLEMDPLLENLQA